MGMKYSFLKMPVGGCQVMPSELPTPRDRDRSVPGRGSDRHRAALTSIVGGVVRLRPLQWQAKTLKSMM